MVLAAPWATPEDRECLESFREQGVEILTREIPAWRSLLNCLQALPSREPLQAVYSWNKGMAQDLEETLRRLPVDVIHVEHLRGARYALHLKRVLEERGSGNNSRIPLIWDSVDCISHLFDQARQMSSSVASRFMARLEQNRSSAYEGSLMHQFDRVLVTSEADGVQLQQRATAGNGRNPLFTVLRNGVDLDYFQASGGEREPATVVMSGKMSYHANVTAARYLVEEIMPLVWSRRPEVRVVIVGKNPSRQVRTLGTVRRGAVSVTGEVPDIRPYLTRATVAVAPLVYGAGIQNKVLEAMSSGTPVVASPQATAALAAEDGREVLVGETPARFADGILALLENRELCESVGRSGRKYAENHHCWDAVAAGLESIYEEAIEAKAPALCESLA
jgi:glycosyltransferase involved in cell wall biosynthesis